MSKSKQKKAGKGKLIVILIALVVVLGVVFGAVSYFCASKTSEGSKSITIVVIDDNAASSTYEAKTDAEYLSEVFDEIEGLSVEGYDSGYGLYITTINGLTADYEADGAYWCIYVNGEYGMYGADSQPVTDGDEYTLAYEVYSY